jgi:hypothetical protein
MRQSLDIRNEFLSDLSKWEIDGHHIKEELLAKTSDLPFLFKGILREIKDLKNAIAYYIEFKYGIFIYLLN